MGEIKISSLAVGLETLSGVWGSREVYADFVWSRTVISYDPSYYIAIAVAVVLVMLASLLILMKIRKSNQRDKIEEAKTTEAGADGEQNGRNGRR